MSESVVTVDRSSAQYQKVRSDIEAACVAISASRDSKAQNYLPANFDLDAQAALSISYRDGRVSCFTTVFKRDFYPEGTYRVFNRFWRNPEFRKYYPNKFIPQEVLTLIQQQYLFCKNSINAQFIFMSRQKDQNLWLQHMLPDIQQITAATWHMSEKNYLVCANRESDACWQKLFYCHLKEGAELVPLEAASEK